MGKLDGLGLDFDETMSGWVCIGETDFAEGLAKGKEQGTDLSVDLKISIADLDQFLNISHHTANLTGTVSLKPLGGPFTIRDGVFNLFSVDPVENIRHMTYTLFGSPRLTATRITSTGTRKSKTTPALT